VLVGRATDAQNKVKALYRKSLFDQTDQEWQKSIEAQKAESAKYSFINLDSLNSVFYLVGSLVGCSPFVLILEMIMCKMKFKGKVGTELFSIRSDLPKDWL